MAKTLLQAVNEVSKRVGLFHGDSNAFTSLTSTSKQRTIDILVQVINEGIDELYSVTGEAKPLEGAEATISLVTGQRSYALASDLHSLHFPFIDKTNTQYIYEHPGGYYQMLLDDPEQDDEGLPHTGAINPTNGEFHLDRDPESQYNGRTYTYQYHKDTELGNAAATMPFNDVVFRAMVPVWTQLYRRDMQKEFDDPIFRASMGRAARLLSRTESRKHWSPRSVQNNMARFGFVVD